MPNTFAYIALFTWPLVVVILFRRLTLPPALIWSVLGGYLILPPQTGIDLPVFPPLDKNTVPSFMAAIMCMLHKDSKHLRATRQAQPLPGMRKTIACCLALLFVGILLTGLTNSESLFVGRFLPGMTAYDIGSMALDAIVILLPFFLARRHLASQEAQIKILRSLVLAGVAYSLLIVIEVRLSPQLNKWFYGFYAHSFAQQIRFGGFRPMVFIEHGLRVALFMVMSLLACATLWRFRSTLHTSRRMPRQNRSNALSKPWGVISIWLFVVLILCKSVGAIIIALLLLISLLLLSPRKQTLITSVLALAVLLYPLLRSADLVPTEALVNWAAAIDPDRSQSLQFRFDNEDILLDRANEKPLAGWGTFGRNRVFDPDTGRDLSVTDGTWVIFMGTYGWIGYLARFGFLTLPILFMVWRDRHLNPASAGLAMILAANLLYLIPNSGLTPITWMIAGVLSARVGQERNEHSEFSTVKMTRQKRGLTPYTARDSRKLSKLRQ